MVDRNLVHELLVGIQQRLLHERLAQAMSRASAERQLAFGLAALIEEHMRDVVAIPPWDALSHATEADLVVLPRRSAVHRADGTLAPPTSWPMGAVAIELADVRLASGPLAADSALAALRSDLTRKREAPGRELASWLGLALITDAAWADTPAREAAQRASQNVRVSAFRPCPPGLLCVGSVMGTLAFRTWRGDAWVEAYGLLPAEAQAVTAEAAEAREGLRVAPPRVFAGAERESLAFYATHGEDEAPLEGDALGPALLRVTTEVLHEHRRDQYERLGVWGGTFDELRLCLFVEERLWRAADDAPAFEQVPGVSQLVRELRDAWAALGAAAVS